MTTATSSFTPSFRASSPRRPKIEVEDDIVTVSGEHQEYEGEKDKH
ncbi:MAG: hypothetical protein ACLP0L_18615 [Solirubrobacteraceae bacterium]